MRQLSLSLRVKQTPICASQACSRWALSMMNEVNLSRHYLEDVSMVRMPRIWVAVFWLAGIADGSAQLKLSIDELPANSWVKIQSDPIGARRGCAFATRPLRRHLSPLGLHGFRSGISPGAAGQGDAGIRHGRVRSERPSLAIICPRNGKQSGARSCRRPSCRAPIAA